MSMLAHHSRVMFQGRICSPPTYPTTVKIHDENPLAQGELEQKRGTAWCCL